jgi:hypothetical protein
MLDSATRASQLALAVNAVLIDAAHAEVRTRLAANEARDTEPPSYIASLDELRAAAGHEARHAYKAARSEGFTIATVVLRSDATGCCTVTGSGTGYAVELDRIVFALVGPAADIEVRASYDIVIARLKIDALNARQIGPHISYRQAAELAVNFTDEHAQSIRNIALALLDARELDHFAVDLFGRCGQR